MKTLKYIALSLLVAASTTACKDDPELLTTDVGPEMTVVSADASGVYGGKVDFEVTMTDRYALSTLKAQVFFDDEMVAEEVIRTKSDGTYTGAVTLPFYKNIPDGTTISLIKYFPTKPAAPITNPFFIFYPLTEKGIPHAESLFLFISYAVTFLLLCSFHCLLLLSTRSVVLCHDLYQFRISSLLRIPSKHCLSLGRITPQIIYVCRTEPFGIYTYQHFTGSLVISLLIHTGAFPTDINTVGLECTLCKISYRMLFTGCNNEIFRGVML